VAEQATPPPAAAPDGPAPALPPACAAVRDALHRRADGEELAPAEAKALDAHLGGCDDCAAELRRAGAFSTHVSKLLGGLKPPDDIRRKVLGRIGPLGGRKRMVAGAAALAGVALAGVAALLLSREAPAARIASADGQVRVLAFSGRGWRSRAGAREVRRGERVEVARGGAATLAVGAGEVVLTGPTLVQLGPADEGVPEGVAVHCIRETSLSVSASGGTPIELVAGGVRVEVAGARVGLKVSRDGGCRLEVLKGEVRATDASGERTVGEGEKVDLAQPAGTTDGDEGDDTSRHGKGNHR
jgi:ferric-dicitrate binding protein FerR (iron transport regulator)